MPDMMMVVDTVLTEIPVNLLALIDDTDFKTRETTVAYDAAGMDLRWNFVTTAGVYTSTAVTPTTGGGDYDWVHKGDGMYCIGMPDSGGASANNDATGFGWFTGIANGVCPFRGPVIQISPSHIVKGMVDGTEFFRVDPHAVTFSVMPGSPGTLTVKMPDGTTTAYTKDVDTDPTAEPITGAS